MKSQSTKLINFLRSRGKQGASINEVLEAIKGSVTLSRRVKDARVSLNCSCSTKFLSGRNPMCPSVQHIIIKNHRYFYANDTQVTEDSRINDVQQLIFNAPEPEVRKTPKEWERKYQLAVREYLNNRGPKPNMADYMIGAI